MARKGDNNLPQPPYPLGVHRDTDLHAGCADSNLMNSSDSNLPIPSEEDPREIRIGELINEFFDRRQRGENLSREDFLASHPEEAEELRGHLSGLDLIDDLVASSGAATLPVNDPAAFKGSSAELSAEESTSAKPDIPGYEILKQIGRGGMGIVYKAKQISTKRFVALKLLLEGPFATDTAKRRFEREIALAAHLRHPNIIPIYDSGKVAGRMYFAMEHVYGLPLGSYVRSNQPSLKDKLRLFVKICNAVNHAHQRGVIHRDVKPSNILVDADGEPHILDFGLAKAGYMADMSTSLTAQIVGTPAYMSPEQAAGDPSGIDIRSDVYSLGIVLFEMLTGKMPYETNVAIGKILNNIAHAEPEPPHKLDSKVDGELSALVLHALEKGKDDRYQTVHSMSADIGRYLAGEPITAKPPSSLYLLRKIAHKHRYALGVVAILVFSTTAILGMFSTLQTTREETRQLHEQITQQDEKVKTLEEDAKTLEGQRDLAAQEVKNIYDYFGEQGMPSQAKPLFDRLATGMARGEGSLVTLSKLANDLLSESPDEQSTGEGTTSESSKKLAYDPTRPLMSPLPVWTRNEKPPRDIPPEVAQAAEVLKMFLLGKPIPQTQATSQPSPSDIPAQEATTSAPAPPTPPPTENTGSTVEST